MPEAGRYLLMWDARTYHANNGFLKVRIKVNGQLVDSSDRMVTEYVFVCLFVYI